MYPGRVHAVTIFEHFSVIPEPSESKYFYGLKGLTFSFYALLTLLVFRFQKNLLRRQMMNIQPLHDRVIVKRVEEEQTTKGGIIIPDTAKEKPQEGIITAVGSGRIEGEGKKKTPLDVKKGDRVLFSKYAGSEITIDGEEHLIMKEEDIIAIIK
jgi:chaperonin GroES